MMITKKHLSRRTFIRGTFGAAMALPLLDAMVPALVAQSKTAAGTGVAPFRFGAIYMPNGVFPDTWHPDTAGANFQFKPVMQPLEPFRDQLVTVSKMRAPWGASVRHASAEQRAPLLCVDGPRGPTLTSASRGSRASPPRLRPPRRSGSPARAHRSA